MDGNVALSACARRRDLGWRPSTVHGPPAPAGVSAVPR